MKYKNIEIESALQIIKLLKQYKKTKNDDEKIVLLDQMTNINGFILGWLIRYNTPIDEIIKKIKKAISLDKYRPKNMPVIHFAMDKDLDYVNGEFCTFDRTLSKMIKNNVDNKKIRNRFNSEIPNIDMMAKQFSADWIQRLNDHKKLVNATRKAKESDIPAAYNKLFNVLSYDFYKKYGYKIKSKVLKNWDELEFKPSINLDKEMGLEFTQYTIDSDKNFSDFDIEKISTQLLNDKNYKHPGFYIESNIRINIEPIKKSCPNDDIFFYTMITTFVHEIHHSLDHRNPEQGAIGSQISFIDRKTYTNYSENKRAYYKSATEQSSYQIERLLFDQLVRTNF